MKKGYKVILKYSRESCAAGLTDLDAILKYPRGVEVTPRRGFGPLAVFAFKRDAECFVRDNTILWKRSPCKIAKCDYLSSRRRILRAKAHAKRILPTGTKLAESVTCLE